MSEHLQPSRTPVARRRTDIFEDAPFGLFAVAADGRIRAANGYGGELLGYAPAELIGRFVIDLYADAPAGKRKARDMRAKFLAGEAIEGEDLQMRRKDGSAIWINLWSKGIRDSTGRVVESRSVVLDISRRKDAEEQLERGLSMLRRAEQARRQLLRHLVRAQEEERRRIAADIHDDPLQVMGTVAIRLGMMRHGSTDAGQLAQLTELEEAVEDCARRLRHLALELRPPGFNGSGLGPAIRTGLASLSGKSGCTFAFEDRLTLDPGPDASLIAFRVVQEALANVRKHARARHIRVLAEHRDEGLFIRVDDDGVGFRPEDPEAHEAGHIGLSLMRERAEMVGGWLRIRSEPGEGTTCEFWIPGRRSRRRQSPA